MTSPYSASVNQPMPLHAVLDECLKHFVYADRMNAAMHCATVRYSPITFRVAEALMPFGAALDDDTLLREVLDDLGLYEEDKGR